MTPDPDAAFVDKGRRYMMTIELDVYVQIAVGNRSMKSAWRVPHTGMDWRASNSSFIRFSAAMLIPSCRNTLSMSITIITSRNVTASSSRLLRAEFNLSTRTAREVYIIAGMILTASVSTTAMSGNSRSATMDIRGSTLSLSHLFEFTSAELTEYINHSFSAAFTYLNDRRSTKRFLNWRLPEQLLHPLDLADWSRTPNEVVNFPERVFLRRLDPKVHPYHSELLQLPPRLLLSRSFDYIDLSRCLHRVLGMIREVDT
ncbi:hypothetical protein BDZ89DRAFT_747519 [Hymenopellis radicata]|nr:hypothetical protein BDZ89DRAFT_747519 [Hymenopellis radicata]